MQKFFTPNEGTTDRILRVTLGLAAILAGSFWLSGLAQIILVGVGIVALGTGAVGFCGLYTLFGINTCPMKTKSKKKS